MSKEKDLIDIEDDIAYLRRKIAEDEAYDSNSKHLEGRRRCLKLLEDSKAVIQLRKYN